MFWITYRRHASRRQVCLLVWDGPAEIEQPLLTMHIENALASLVVAACLAGTSNAVEPVARWELTKSTPNVDAREIKFEDGTATFNGRSSQVIVPADRLPPLGTLDFTVTAWLHTDEVLDDVPGDVISQ